MLRILCSLVLFMATCSIASAQTEVKFLVVEFPEHHKKLFIRGETDLSAVQAGSSDSHLLIKRRPPRTVSVTGRGEMRYREHRIIIGRKSFSFDGAELSKDDWNFVLTEEGHLEKGFCPGSA